MMGGSEIFVPKIPSMKMTDLASCLAPELPHRQIGIRPGEKLHEVMVTEDDSRLTYDLGDRYVIGPPFDWWDKEPIVAAGGKPVEEGFRYASDCNSEWLDGASLLELMENN
jgi:UDP-N-acetylglucosamine 4,6-dehydratase